MSSTFHWAVLGAGRIARKFVHDLQFLPNAKLYAVGSKSIERAQQFAQEHDGTKAYGSYEAMVQDSGIDAIYIASRHIQHFDNALLCVSNGIPTLCEKPFAINATQVQQMIALSQSKQVFLMEALWTRFLPAIQKVKEIIDQNKIGSILSITADFGFKAKYDPSGRLFNHQLAGGAILDIGIYPIFLAYLIKGMPSEIAAFAKIGPTRVDEQCSVLFKYEDGGIAELSSTILSDTPKVARIYGEKGFIHIDGPWHKADQFEVSYYDGRNESYTYPRKSFGYEFEAQEVINCVGQQKLESELWSHQDSLHLIQLLDKVRSQVDMIYDFEQPSHTK